MLWDSGGPPSAEWTEEKTHNLREGHENLLEALESGYLHWMNYKDLWASWKVGMDEGLEQQE